MKSNSDKQWIIDVLTGKLPDKTEQYYDWMLKKRIIELYCKINGVTFYSTSKSHVISCLSEYPYIIDIIYDRIQKVYSMRREKVEIVYFKNSKLKFDIKLNTNPNRIYVAIPSEDNFD